MTANTFSRRLGYQPTEKPITVREEAPEFFRSTLLNLAQKAGLEPSEVRQVICAALRVMPDRDNWSEYPNIQMENEGHLEHCEWFRVYDIAEALYERLTHPTRPRWQPSIAASFQNRLNEEMVADGIGWKMVNGRFETRGDPAFEATLSTARTRLAAAARPTAAGEIAEALRDLSRRPVPDRTGAIQHAMAALECAARDVVADPKPTLGDLMKRYRDKLGIPAPLDAAVEKAWGYASEVGRHLREGREPSRDEAELVVSLCAALCVYLSPAQLESQPTRPTLF